MFGSRGYQWVLDADIEACFDRIDPCGPDGPSAMRAKAERVLALVDKDWDWPPGARRVVLTAVLGSPLADSAERPSTAAPPPNPLAALSLAAVSSSADGSALIHPRAFAAIVLCVSRTRRSEPFPHRTPWSYFFGFSDIGTLYR